MPKALVASHNGTCGRCGQPYEVGDSLTYSKLVPGDRYHFPNCAAANAKRIAASASARVVEPVAPLTAVTVPATPFTSAAIDLDMPKAKTTTPDQVDAFRALIASIEANSGRSTTVAATTSPVPVVPSKPITTADAERLIRKINSRSPWWDKLEALFAAGLTRILLVGPPGTGKSTTADRDGLRVTCHEDAGPESMVGTFIQQDGNTIFIKGPSVVSMQNGTRVVLDEIDHTSPECVSLLYALLDDAPSIVLPTGENAKAVKGYQVVCTSNGNPADLPDAILDRIEAVLVADTPHPAAVAGVRANAGVKADKLVDLMSNYYRGLSKSGYEFRGNPTLRKVRNFAKLLAAGLNQDVAAEAVFGKGAKEVVSAMTTSSVK